MFFVRAYFLFPYFCICVFRFCLFSLSIFLICEVCDGTWWSAFSTGLGDKEGEQVDEVDIGLYRMVTVMMMMMVMRMMVMMMMLR